jgi:molybdopterin-guanine dinucleotide biosynthesis protein A
MPSVESWPATQGVILAGGLATRMGGGDKGLKHLGGETILHHIVRRLAPQCDGLVLNANGDPTRFENLHLPVVPDVLPGHPGPLAGILSALEWTAAHRPEVEWVMSVSGDTPFVPVDLVMRLHKTRQTAGKALACASSGGRLHPTIGLWPVRLKDDLRCALIDEGLRSVRHWAERQGLAVADWSNAPFDPFCNINTQEDLMSAEKLLAGPLRPALERE